MSKKNGRARHMAEVHAKRRKQQGVVAAQIEVGMDELHSEEASDAALSDTDAEDAELEDEMVMEVVDEGPATRSGNAAAGQAARRARGSEAQRRSRAVRLALSQSLDELPEELRSEPDLPAAPLLLQRPATLASLGNIGVSTGKARAVPM
jgi:hypothetical protein